MSIEINSVFRKKQTQSDLPQNVPVQPQSTLNQNPIYQNQVSDTNKGEVVEKIKGNDINQPGHINQISGDINYGINKGETERNELKNWKGGKWNYDLKKYKKFIKNKLIIF